MKWAGRHRQIVSRPWYFWSAALGLVALLGCEQLLGLYPPNRLGEGGAGGSGAAAAGGMSSQGGAGGGPVCQADEERACYSGTDETRGIGSCKDGTQSCDADGVWPESCDGEVLPQETDQCEVDENGNAGYLLEDRNCNGLTCGQIDPLGSGVILPISGSGTHQVLDLEIDSQANIWLLGRYKGELSVGEETLPDSTVSTMFLAKFDSAGKRLFARGYVSQGTGDPQEMCPTPSVQPKNQSACDLAIDSEDQPIIVVPSTCINLTSFGGLCNGSTDDDYSSVDFGNGTPFGGAGTTAVLVKLDSSGNTVLWQKEFTGPVLLARIATITVDSQDRIWFTGSHSPARAVGYEGVEYAASASGAVDVFRPLLGAVDKDGNFLWAESFIGTAGAMQAGASLTARPTSNVNVTQLYWTVLQFVPQVPTDPPPTASLIGKVYDCYTDRLITQVLEVKNDDLAAGPTFDWDLVGKFVDDGTGGSGGGNSLLDLQVDTAFSEARGPYTVLAGSFKGTFEITSSETPSTDPLGPEDTFDSFGVVVDNSGKLAVAPRQFGTSADDRAFDVAVSDDGFVYLLMSCGPNMVFAPAPKLTDEPPLENAVCVAKFAIDTGDDELDIVWSRRVGGTEVLPNSVVPATSTVPFARLAVSPPDQKLVVALTYRGDMSMGAELTDTVDAPVLSSSQGSAGILVVRLEP